MVNERFHPADESTVLHESLTRWPGVDLLEANSDVRRPTQWEVYKPRHTVIVHLGGWMSTLETEVDSHGGSRGPALPGECWMIPAGQRYLSRIHGKTIQYAVLSVDPQISSAFSESSPEPFDLMVRSAVRDPFLHQSVLQLIQVSRESTDVARMLGQVLSQAVCLHLRRMHGGGAWSARAHRSAVYDAVRARRLRDFIHDRLDEELDLQQLASLTGQTTHQMLVSFRETFGKTPWQYIVGERLRCAQRLLCVSRKDITTIAFETGFSSHSHLTRVFRKQLGCSPSEYRASQRLASITPI